MLFDAVREAHGLACRVKGTVQGLGVVRAHEAFGSRNRKTV
ncbi:hypothetical protein APY03_5010 [Variovorax sp. WDL1]|nr:hypothetical protein APY03_5010 [Variovorax sp. WDL1]